MESFNIIAPSTLLAPYVKYYWILKANHADGVLERTIPTGYVHLIFHKEGQMFSSFDKKLQPQAFVGGQVTHYTDLSSTSSVFMIVVVFQPFGGKAFFNIPMCEFNQKNVSVGDLHDNELEELEKRIYDTADNNICIRQIEAFLLKRLSMAKIYKHNRMEAAVKEINTLSEPSIKTLAENACLSYKQFNRVFNEYVGINPKEFSRIVRFQRALHILQTHTRIKFTEVAYHCNYTDLSHLIKEFKSFSGYTPTEYLAACNPYSDYFTY